MNIYKTIVFGLLFTASVVSAGSILYSQQNSKNNSVTPVTVIKEQPEVKGSEIKSKEYTRENSLKHLDLTRENIIWFTNYERVKNNKVPLKMVGKLNASSNAKNTDMIAFQYFEHKRIKGPNQTVGFDFFIDDQNYEFIKIGENLAMGDFSTSPEVVSAWMNSPAHKKNILDSGYQEIGVSIREAVMSQKNTLLIVQHFGSPRNSCPTVDESTKEAIGVLRKKLTTLQATISDKQKNIALEEGTPSLNFEALISEYNNLVSTYNESIKQVGELVQKYNTQLQSFDRCVQGKR